MTGQPTELEVVADEDAPATQAALERYRFLHCRPALKRPDDHAGRDGASSRRPVAPGRHRSDPPFSIRSHSSALRHLGSATPSPFNPSNFVLTGYVTMFVFFSAAMGAGAVVRERQNQTLERLLLQWRQARCCDSRQVPGRDLQGTIADSGLVDIWNIRVPDRLGPSSRSCNPDLVARGPGLVRLLASC